MQGCVGVGVEGGSSMHMRHVGLANDLPGRVFMPPYTLLHAGESVPAFLDANHMTWSEVSSRLPCNATARHELNSLHSEPFTVGAMQA